MADNQQYWPLAQKPETAKDIRRVVANATRTKGKWLTIANKDELNNRKQEEQIANNVNKSVSKGTVAPVSSSTPKVTLQPTQPQPIWPVKPNTDLFKNPQLSPINNIQVIKQDNQAQNIQNNNNWQDNFINTHWRATELKTPIDIDNALMDLYSDIKEKINRNELNNVNVQWLKQAYSEFTNMDDEVVTSLVSDIASMINKKLPFSVDNMKKLKSLYPELASAAWWFDVWWWQNMYQGWWLKETLSSWSPTDLNKRWPVWVAAETVLNPLWQATTVLDSASQSIWQVDNNTDKILWWDIKSTPELKQALSKVVSDEKLLNKYYEEYQNYVKEHGVLSNLYTDFYEWDTLVEKLWNVARGKKKVNVDAWFKSWLVDKVNNQVNWWQWEFWWAANQLNDVQWPNVAKMYSNVPASTVKTATAITRAITNPVDTVSWLVHLIGTEEWHQALAARYGSWEAFANAIEQDPVGTSSDALAVVEWWASATRAVASLGTKWALSASIATEMLWAARTSESLFKIASRLEKLSSKAWAIEKIAWTSSNLWVDIPLKWWMVQIWKETKVINWIIKWLREWWESWDSMIKKVAKYSADRSEQWIWKIAKDTKDFLKEWPVNSLANKLMGTASDTDKLFKAANPNINTLRNTTDYKNKRANMDLATKTIVESWYTPKTISEWAKAHAATLNKKWNEFKQLIKDKSDVEVDSSEVLHEIKDFIKREKEWATVNQRWDIRALELEVQDLEKRWKLSMDVIENKKEHYNSSWKDSEKMKKWDIYEKWVKILWNSMRKVQDNILGKWPESTKALRQQIKALMDTKEDIYKADVRNQKKKSDIAWWGVIESYWRLAWVWDILKGWLQLLGNPWEWLANIGKWAWKVVFWKAMWKARDVDYLTKKGFEWLSKKNKKQSSEWLREKMQERRELSELRDKRKELDKKYKEGKISDDEYLKQSEEVEYWIAQKRARLSVIWDKEMKMDSKTRAKMVDLVKKRAKDVWFATEVIDWMEKDTQGYTDLQKKLIALEKNPWDTTAQHELFHAFFSVVDNKTKTYILDEAKKILKEKWLSDINAEEWLAESFGIYAKRQQIKLWLIDAPKWFKSKLRDFFQRVYEFMQRFNWDRATINKLFDEILWDRKMKNWIMDLSDLLWNKKVNERTLYWWRWEWLRNKTVYHGSKADFDKYSLEHVWEWEWNQSHWHWLYFAADKKVAEKYASLGKQFVNKKTWAVNLTWPEAKITGMLNWWYTFKEAIEKSKADSKRNIEYFENNIKEAKAEWVDEKTIKELERRLQQDKDYLKKLESYKEWDFKQVWQANLYTNEIPDPIKKDTPTWENYLYEDDLIEWDWMDKFVDAVKKELWPDAEKEFNKKILDDWSDTKRRWWEVYQWLKEMLWTDVDASKFLEKLWYDWIWYYWWLDGESYVIFNDKTPKITDHIRYKKKIWDKEVEINKDITSPDQMAKINSKGLSVIHDFISEKQAEKALDVSKDILDENGNAYLWTHTNKYNDKMFSQFENTRDNRYKDFEDTEVAFFSNSEDMSKSYADQKSKLAPTKKFNSVEEVNDYFKKNPVVDKWKWWHESENERIKNYRMVKAKDLKGNDYWKLESQKVEKSTYDSLASLWDAYRDDWMKGNLWEMPKNPEEAIKILKEKRFWNATEIKQLKSWKVQKKDTYDWEYVWWYDTDKEAIAKWYAEWTKPSAYHYQWIIQDVKNPLVVDVRNQDWTQTFWNKLWNAKEFIKKEYPKFDKYMDKVEEKFNEAYNAKKSFDVWMDSVNDKKWELQWEVEKLEKWTPEREKATEKVTQLRLARDKIERIFMWYVEPLTAEERAIPIKNNRDLWFYYDMAKEKYDKYKDVYDIWKWYDEVLHRENPNIWTAYTEAQASLHKGFFKFLENQEWFDKWLISLLHRWMPEEINLYMFQWGDPIRISLGETKLQTNDYVFYALSKWGYDWVIFKNIADYGWDSKLTNWWDVLTTFKSKNFKSWDNANPTDSKYISYKKKVWLDKKPEWLQKKDSNWLLAKGRDRMWDNGMRYKKSEYEQAVESWDKEKALWMIRKAAAEKGYDSSSDYQWSKAFNGSAPSSEWYTKAERINPDTEMYSQTLGDYASDGVDIWDLDWQLTDRWNYIRWDEYIRESIDNLNKAVIEYKEWNKNAKIKMYRAIDADIKENWFRNGDWITPSKKYAKMHIWLQDWKKWRIIEEEVPIENIWWDNNDINEWWYDDGKEYWYKNTPNNKKELWITYDDKGKLIPLEKRFDEKNPDVRFKKKSEVPEDKKLIWLHNLSVDKLRKTVELWGMPMPSIAVTKKWIPHTDYWDVTFIMKESAINPKLNRNNKLYTVDGYTPMAQQPIVKMKDTKDAWAIEDKIEKETWLSYSEIEQWIENKEQMEYYHPELKKFDKEYNQMTEKKLWGWFTPSGKRRYLDYNLDNVVKKMKENKEDAFNWMYWKMVAQYEWETKTVDSLRERNYGLKNKEVWEELFNRYYNEVWDLYAKLWWWDSFREMWYFQDTLSYEYDRNTDRWLEKVKKDQPKGSIYEKLQKSDLEKLQKTIKEGAELQRPYSEAKPERWIRFDEVWAVVAPEGKLKEVKDMLKDTWLKVYWYKEGERMSVVDKVADDNGLRFKKAYHGSHADFDKFSTDYARSWEWWQAHWWGIYTAKDKEIWKKYASLKHWYWLQYKWEWYDAIKSKAEKAWWVDNLWLEDRVAYRLLNETKWTNMFNRFLSFDEAKKNALSIIDNRIAISEYTLKNKEKRPNANYDEIKKELDNAKEEKKAISNMKEWDMGIWEVKDRHLYELDIPDEVKADTPTWKNYFLETKNYWEKTIQKFVDALWEKHPELKDKLQNRVSKNMSWRLIYLALSDVLWSDKNASKFLESIWYDWIHAIWYRDWDVRVLFNENNAQIKDHIRYKKWLEKKPSYNVPQASKTKIWNWITKMRNVLKTAWISYVNNTSDWPLKNAVKNIVSMNKEKDKFRWTSLFNQMIQWREEGMMWIIDAIDKWYNSENLHYKWFYDPISWRTNNNKKRVNRPTLFIWEWDFNNALQTAKDFKNWLIQEKDLKLWAQHMDIDNNTWKSVNKSRNSNWKLEKSPLRWN